jgi:hypothetical protein
VIDAIVGVSVLHHVNLDLTFENTFRRLGPGECFAFSGAEPREPADLARAKCRHRQALAIRHLAPTAFTAGRLRRLFEDSGFRVDVCEPFEFLHPATPACLIGAVSAVERMIEQTLLRSIGGSLRIAGSRTA